MELILIAAVADNDVIGNKRSIPWKIKEDMQHFRQLTMGHPVLMGRKTYDSIPRKYRPLEGRLNLVVSRQGAQYPGEDVKIYRSLDLLLHQLHRGIIARESIDASKVYVAGGAEIYKELLPRASRLEITHVRQRPDGDAYFPKIDWALWEKVRQDEREGYSFATYRRV